MSIIKNFIIIRVSKPFVLGYCWCGCGTEIPIKLGTNTLRKYVLGHHQLRERHHRWKRGYTNFNGKGYVKILRKHHKYADVDGRVYLHRYRMELMLGRYLDPKEVVHHIDGNKHNNEESNLQLFENHSKHVSFEQKKDMSTRNCFLCNSNETYIDKRGNTIWLKFSYEFICHTCYFWLKRIGKRKVKQRNYI